MSFAERLAFTLGALAESWRVSRVRGVSFRRAVGRLRRAAERAWLRSRRIAREPLSPPETCPRCLRGLLARQGRVWLSCGVCGALLTPGEAAEARPARAGPGEEG